MKQKAIEHLKNYGQTILVVAAILSLAGAVAKPHAEKHIEKVVNDTVEQRINKIETQQKEITDDQEEIAETQKKIMTLLTIMADDKEIEEFKKKKDAFDTLKGK